MKKISKLRSIDVEDNTFLFRIAEIHVVCCIDIVKQTCTRLELETSRLCWRVEPGVTPPTRYVGAEVMNGSESALRFAQRYKEDKFRFMAPDVIRDKQKRRPDEEDYDGSTCYIPGDWFKKYKVSDGQRQWWDFKSKNWDSVLLFKMGKVAACLETINLP